MRWHIELFFKYIGTFKSNHLHIQIQQHDFINETRNNNVDIGYCHNTVWIMFVENTFDYYAYITSHVSYKNCSVLSTRFSMYIFCVYL